MMEGNVITGGWLPAWVPAPVPAAAALALAFLWFRLPSPGAGDRRWRTFGRFLLRAATGFATLAAAAETARRFVVFATSWPVEGVLALGALGVEAARFFYGEERSAVRRVRGRVLTLLRTLLILSVTWMLCQPVLVWESVRSVRRRLVVLVDESASMDVWDDALTAAEKVRWAEALAFPGVERPYRWEAMAVALRQARDRLLAHTDALAVPRPTGRREQSRFLARQQEALEAVVAQTQDTIGTVTNALADIARWSASSSPALMSTLSGLTTSLLTEAVLPLEEARAARKPIEETGVSEPQGSVAAAGLRRAAEALSQAQGVLQSVGDQVDALYYAACREEIRRACDALAAWPRVERARSLLADRDDPRVPESRREGFLRRMRERRGVRLFTFAADAVERSPLAWLSARDPGRSGDVSRRHRTDLAAALETVAALPAQQTAGVLLLTDGRHNAARPWEPVARQLAQQSIPVWVLPFGAGPQPPTDAALADVEAPTTVGTNDRVVVRMNVKLDGLAGTNVTVRLYDGEQLVASNALSPAGVSFRTSVQLSHVPGTPGLHPYRVELDAFPREVLTNNNTAVVPIWVNPDRTRVLLMDGFPRWEFRYLKNLFLRDTTLQVQYLLFHPDTVAGITGRTERAASVTADEAEATRPPETEADWMKFDLIVIGDVAPAELGPAGLDALRQFVTQRGGTLIAIAGPRHLPHAWTETPLADLLPVTARPSARAQLEPPEPAFLIALTPEGERCGFLRMADADADHREIWAGFPSLFWRHPLDGVREGASVLAWAVPGEATDTPLATWTWRLQERANADPREVQRARAVIVSQHHGRGKVLFLATDQTWRLRHRHGDLYHHRLWGQIVRWAAADRVAFGNDRFRVETDRPRYGPDQTIRVRARAIGADYAPLPDASVRVVVRAGDRVVLRRRLPCRSETSGLYEAELGPLPVGPYRVELDVETRRGERDPLGEGVAADFAVVPDRPSECVELAADRDALAQLAAMTGGALLEPSDVANLESRLGPPIITLRERRQHDLWSAPELLSLVLLLAACEWWLRKKERLP